MPSKFTHEENGMQKSTIFVFLSAIFFALGGLFFKIIPWDALAIGAARSVLASISILIFLLIKKHQFKINRTVIISALAIAITNTLYALSNKLTTAGNAIVLQFSMPVFVILLMFVFFHKKPSKLEVITCILVFLGIVCFFIDSLSAGNMLGNMLALLGGMTYACFFIFNSRPDSEPFTTILLSYIVAFLIGLPSLIKTDFIGTPVPALFAVLALGVLQQGAGHIFFAIGIKKTSAVTASLISGIEPILNPILVAIFYHEMLTPLSFVGAAVVLISVIGYNYLEARKKEKASKTS